MRFGRKRSVGDRGGRQDPRILATGCPCRLIAPPASVRSRPRPNDGPAAKSFVPQEELGNCRGGDHLRGRRPIVQGTGQGPWQGLRPIVASAHYHQRPAPAPPPEGVPTYSVVGESSCTLVQVSLPRRGTLRIVRASWGSGMVIGIGCSWSSGFSSWPAGLGPAVHSGIRWCDRGPTAPGEPSRLAPRTVAPRGTPGSVGHGWLWWCGGPGSGGGSPWTCTYYVAPPQRLGGFPPVARHRAGGTR